MEGMQLLFLSFSRDDEREADRLGVEYSSKIGYDAHKMADFFQVLVKMNMASNQAGVPTFLSTHPDPGDRYNSVNQQATEWQNKLGLAAYKVNGESYLRMINGMVYGEDPRQGYVAENTFFHPELKFKFSIPEGWLLENSPAQVRMAPKDGNALIVFTLSPQKTVEEASQSSLKELGLTITENRKATVNGLPALVTLSNQVSQDQSTGQQKTIMVLSYFIDYNGSIYVFHGVSDEADFKNFSPLLDRNMSTFSKLTDPSKMNVKPRKVIVKSVTRAGTLADAFQSFGVKQAQMKEFALLNNMELTDKVQAGKLVKVIGE
jgi:predicted Zn-dependent protease